eukprot:gene23192-9520_t
MFETMRDRWTQEYGQVSKIPVGEACQFIRGPMPRELSRLPFLTTDLDMLKTMQKMLIPVDDKLRVEYKYIVYGCAWQVFGIDLQKVQE